MTTQPRRRWFRLAFGLRTLFVVVTLVAVPLGWLAYSMNWIRQRSHFNAIIRYERASSPVPGGLWLFGERAAASVMLRSNATEADRAVAENLFPEAEIWKVGERLQNPPYSRPPAANARETSQTDP